MPFKQLTPALIYLLWAGVSLGGAFVAAPAKFTLESLPLSTALEVGRAQFQWLTYTEYTLLASLLICLSLAWKTHKPTWLWYAIPIIFFLIQQQWLMPILNKITTVQIQGLASYEAHWHIIYIALEGLKFLGLIAAALTTLRRTPIHTASPA